MCPFLSISRSVYLSVILQLVLTLLLLIDYHSVTSLQQPNPSSQATPPGRSLQQPSPRSQATPPGLCSPTQPLACPSHNSTCCLQRHNNLFVCCPHAQAVCCEDGIHCCPSCFTCNIKSNVCVRPATAAAILKITSLIQSPSTASLQAQPITTNVEDEKKEGEEGGGGYVSGVISAVRWALFSSDSAPVVAAKNKDKSAAVPAQQQVNKLTGQLTSSTKTAKQTTPTTTTTTTGPSASGRSSIKSTTTGQQAKGAATVSKVAAANTATKQPASAANVAAVTAAAAAATKKNEQAVKAANKISDKNKEGKEEEEGFFSSVISAVTDTFYSNGQKPAEGEVHKTTTNQKPSSPGGVQPGGKKQPMVTSGIAKQPQVTSSGKMQPATIGLQAKPLLPSPNLQQGINTGTNTPNLQNVAKNTLSNPSVVASASTNKPIAKSSKSNPSVPPMSATEQKLALNKMHILVNTQKSAGVKPIVPIKPVNQGIKPKMPL